MKRTLALAFAFAIATITGACGGSTGSSQPQTEAGLEATARSEFDLIKAGNWTKAYDYLSAECQANLSRSEFASQAIVALAMAKGFGVELKDMAIERLEVRNVADGKGEVLLTTSLSESSDSSPTWDDWVYENGGWHSTECSGLGDSSSTTEEKADQELTYRSGFTPYPPTGRSAPDSTSWAVMVKNPNDTEQAERVTVNITMYDAAGSILKSDDSTISKLPAGSEQPVGDVASDVVGVTRMDVVVAVGSWTKPAKAGGTFTVTGVTSRSLSYGGTEFNGMVSSGFATSESAQVGILMSDETGTPVAFTWTYVNDIPANGNKSFSKSTMSTFPDTWTTTVQAWLWN